MISEADPGEQPERRMDVEGEYSEMVPEGI
jgi:hypothetical protein